MNSGQIGSKIRLGILLMLVLGFSILVACSSSGAEPSPPSGQREVTLADEGKTITTRAGERFLLKLDDTYDWTVTVSDETIVSRVRNITVIHGAQGVYEALNPGNATLTAIGEPVCRSSQPPCAMPSRLFQVPLAVGAPGG